MSIRRKVVRHAQPPKSRRATFQRLSDALDQARARYWALAASGADTRAFNQAASEYERANAEFGKLIKRRKVRLR
jgi:hypothetical protein